MFDRISLRPFSLLWILLMILAVSGVAIAQDDVVEEVVEAADVAETADAADTDNAAEDEKLSRDEKVAKYVKLAESMENSFAVVEITLRYDKGEEPYSRGYIPGVTRSLEDLIAQERPAEIPAYVLSDRLVIAPDPNINERFVKDIVIRNGEQVVKATPQKYFDTQYAVIYETAEPLTNVTPLTFDADAEGPYVLVVRGRNGASWATNITSLPGSVQMTQAWGPRTGVNTYSLIATEDGTPVGMCMNGELATDGWQGSPLQWTGPSAKVLDALLERTGESVAGGIYRVTLEFRSPPKQAGSRYTMDDGEQETERQAIGLLLDSETVLILDSLKPKVTARLERIRVNLPDGEPVTATFSHTLKDYGCLLAKLSAPLDAQPITLSDKAIINYLNDLLPSSEVMIRGEELVTYLQQIRLPRFQLGWRRHVYPTAFGPEQNLFVFDTDMTLLALPIVKREKVSGGDRYGYGRDYPKLTAAAYLREALANLDENVDPSNVPLTEEEEARLAWLGVELQALDEELARANDVSDLTQNGRTGALVTFVYPDSPAAEKGLKTGDILLRLYVEGEPKPIDVTVEYLASYFSGGPFPWERLEEVPEQYYDQIPRPWPPAETTLTRQLTDLGFGKKFEVQVYSGGETKKIPFEVVQSPPHYDTAAKFKSDALGLTVRNITYELRRFFRREENDPGVIVSKVEPGSKASVAGIKPYELITHVNDQPVANVEDFEKLIDGGGELRFSVKRWTKGRVVKMDAAKPADDDAADAEQGDADDAAEAADADAKPDQTPNSPSESEQKPIGQGGDSEQTPTKKPAGDAEPATDEASTD